MSDQKPGKQREKDKKTTIINLVIAGLFGVFIIVSIAAGYEPGIQIGRESWRFIFSMIILFPGAFILISLFEVWVDREIIERHLGEKSGLFAYFWVILLAGTVMAPLIVALPIAHSLAKKGARLQIVLGFIFASTICRISMTIFEATYMGMLFSLVRLGVSIPLVIIFSELIVKLFPNEKIKVSI